MRGHIFPAGSAVDPAAFVIAGTKSPPGITQGRSQAFRPISSACRCKACSVQGCHTQKSASSKSPHSFPGPPHSGALRGTGFCGRRVFEGMKHPRPLRGPPDPPARPIASGESAAIPLTHLSRRFLAPRTIARALVCRGGWRAQCRAPAPRRAKAWVSVSHRTPARLARHSHPASDCANIRKKPRNWPGNRLYARA